MRASELVLLESAYVCRAGRDELPGSRYTAVTTMTAIYMFGIRAYSVYIHPAPFVRNAIFPHCMLVHVTSQDSES